MSPWTTTCRATGDAGRLVGWVHDGTALPHPSGGGPPSRCARRLLLVHAHPDDESINNGATMAKYAAEGAHVTLITCTLGERGEVIPPALRHLSGAGLAEERERELTAAMKALGVTDHGFLGGSGRYRDSGMMGTSDNDDPSCFWRADVDEAAGHLVEVIREVRPQVLVTYDPDGGYGHPDHIQAHRVAMRAAELAAAAGSRSPRSTGTASRGPSWRKASRGCVTRCRSCPSPNRPPWTTYRVWWTTGGSPP